MSGTWVLSPIATMKDKKWVRMDPWSNRAGRNSLQFFIFFNGVDTLFCFRFMEPRSESWLKLLLLVCVVTHTMYETVT